MDVIKAPTKIEHPVYRAEFKYTPAPGVRGFKGFKDAKIEKRLTGNIMEANAKELNYLLR